MHEVLAPARLHIGLLCLSICLVLLAGFPLPAVATPRPVTLTVEVTSVEPGVTTLAVGDLFTMDFTVEDSITDGNSSTSGGAFPTLITSFAMTADAANAGSWTPSGTFDLAASNYVTNANGDGITFQVQGTGFPDGGAGWTFHDLDLSIGWPEDITDSGLGDTFAQQLGATAFGMPPATLEASAGIRFTDGEDYLGASIAVPSQQPQAEPIPTARPLGLALFALALGAVAWCLLR